MPKKIRDTPQQIETIIHSFERFALGDIQHNRSKPIAAFILSVCFIDQLASFRYRILRDENKRPEDFIRDYMEDYSDKELDFYDKVRHKLVHCYSSNDKFDINNVGTEGVAYAIKNNRIYINTNEFIDRLEKAFERVAIDFRVVGSEAYNNAIENSMYHPVMVDMGS